MELRKDNKFKIIFKKKKLLIIAFLTLILFWLFWNCLPNPLFTDPYSAVLLSKDKHLLGAVISSDQQWRFPPSQIPDKYKIALLEFEDHRFYYHPGVDPIAIGRAFISNIKAGKNVSGASTLTMQVIRLARKNSKRTYFEKLKEIILALRLDLKYSKTEILKLYTSHAPFGGNIVGLNTASWFYFKRNAEELSWAESALLAVLPNSPSLIHPGKNRKKLLIKRNKLLKKLNKKKIINQLEYSLAIAEPLPKKPQPLPRLAPHLLDSLIKKYKNNNSKFFYSTIRKDLQHKVKTICEENSKRLRERGINNVAALIIDNRLSEIVSYVGNTGLNVKQNIGQEVDIIQSLRSTGSILKPLLYGAMLKSGEIAPTSLVPDIPSQFGGYMPENFDHSYRGAISAKEALAQSLNIPAVRMLRQYGIHRFYDFLKHSGMTSLYRPADGYGLTLILGGAEGTLYDITKIYSKLAGLAGNHQKISSVKTLNRKEEPIKKLPLTIGSAFLTTEALLELARPGTEGFWKNFNSTQKIAWKTGTSYGLRDAWAIGLTPNYTVGIWAGNASGQGNADLTGASIAAPILFDVFNLLEKPKSWFKKPNYALKSIQLCKKSGFLPTEQCETELVAIPKESNFSKQCTFHHLIHLDKKGLFRVNNRCESVSNMTHKSWFTLPPIQEFYYRKSHPLYKKLPHFRKDCIGKQIGKHEIKVMNLIYPSKNTIVYIPIDLDEKKSSVIFKAVHRNPKITIFWHLDEKYIGQTKQFHQIILKPKPGKHKLILIDTKGNRLIRNFKVLSKTDV